MSKKKRITEKAQHVTGGFNLGKSLRKGFKKAGKGLRKGLKNAAREAPGALGKAAGKAARGKLDSLGNSGRVS